MVGNIDMGRRHTVDEIHIVEAKLIILARNVRLGTVSKEQMTEAVRSLSHRLEVMRELYNPDKP